MSPCNSSSVPPARSGVGQRAQQVQKRYIYIYIYIEKGQFNKLTTMAGNSNIAEPMMMMKIRTGSDLVEVARS
jgi:hypothetical protein